MFRLPTCPLCFAFYTTRNLVVPACDTGGLFSILCADRERHQSTLDLVFVPTCQGQPGPRARKIGTRLCGTKAQPGQPVDLSLSGLALLFPASQLSQPGRRQWQSLHNGGDSVPRIGALVQDGLDAAFAKAGSHLLMQCQEISLAYCFGAWDHFATLGDNTDSGGQGVSFVR